MKPISRFKISPFVGDLNQFATINWGRKADRCFFLKHFPQLLKQFNRNITANEAFWDFKRNLKMTLLVVSNKTIAWVKKSWQVFLTNGINVHIWCHITINWLSGLHYNRYWHGNLQRHKWYRRRLQLNAHHIMLVTPSKASTDLQILFEICPWWHFGCQNAGFSLKLELIFLILRRNKIFIDNRTQRAAIFIWDCQLTRWVFKNHLHETAGYNILIQSFISRFHALYWLKTGLRLQSD